MPPQAYNGSNLAGTGASGKNTPASATGSAGPGALDDNANAHAKRSTGHGSASKSRGSNRLLGDYILSKTLGAGSMGKVKLATHTTTGEKVSFFDLRSLWLCS